VTRPAGGAPQWHAAPAGPIPRPSLSHLKALLGPYGLFEHACGPLPRHGNGYCTDDAGRALALACRLPDDPHAEELAEATLGFLERAHDGGGGFRLRLGPDGRWTADPPSEDAAGRALLGLGVACSCAPWEALRERAGNLFLQAASFRPRAARAAAYALLGATEAMASPEAPDGLRRAAQHLTRDLIGVPTGLLPGAAAKKVPAGNEKVLPGNEKVLASQWRWPEPRLSYANALLPHACMSAASALGDSAALRSSLELLWWLVMHESHGGHFSFSPVGGRGPGDKKPAFDQQPIEAASMAHACATALALSEEDRWEGPFWAAVGWFLGHNDAGATMWDPATGGGFDGLRSDGVNANQGAESTIAFVSTMVLAQAQAASASADNSSDTDAVAAPT
jgi:hypothetical protein